MNARILMLPAALLASLVSGRAQITITSADMFNEVGSYYLAYGNHYDPTDSSTSFPCTGLMGTTGGPQLWDFSTGPTDEISRYDYVLPAGQDGAEAFPQATIVEHKTTSYQGTTNQNALFFQQVPNVGRRVYGFYDPQFSSETPTNVFQPPVVDFPDQIHYGDTWSTSFVLYTFIDVLDQTIPAQLTYSSVFTVDAYGTVDVPNLGFGSALRVNEAETVTTAVDFDETGDYQNVETDYVRNYYWLRSSHGIVAQLNSTQNTSATPPNNFDQAASFVRMYETNHKTVTGTTGPQPVTDLSATYSKDDGQVLVKWTAPSGTRQFRVEYSADLAGTNSWTTLTNLDNQTYVLDPTAGIKQRFYRVVSVQ